MKTERRHELQTNTLSEVLGHQIEHMRPHGKKLVAVSILGAVVIIAIALIVKDRQSAQDQARNDLYLALSSGDREALKDVAKTHAGTDIALWGKKAQADLDLQNGLSTMYINRDEAIQSLEDAKKGYTEVMNAAGGNRDLLGHALFGLGSANEATSNLEKAREYYERVAKEFPDSPIAIEAKNRLEALNDPQTEKWYSWFARQKSRPRTQTPSMFGAPGMPGDIHSLPDVSNFPPVNIPTDTTPSTTPPSTTGPSTTGPSTTGPAKSEGVPGTEGAKDAAVPATSTPGTSAPAGSAPAGSAPAAPPSETKAGAADTGTEPSAKPDASSAGTPPATGTKSNESNATSTGPQNSPSAPPTP